MSKLTVLEETQLLTQNYRALVATQQEIIKTLQAMLALSTPPKEVERIMRERGLEL